MNCPNCKTKLSCGCKLRTTSSGKQGCTSCITSLEKQNNTPGKKAQIVSPAGQIIRVIAK